MIYRPLGNTSCSVLGLGTGTLASVAMGLTAAARRRLIDTAAESGINLLDTADSYAQGDCESFLGAALAGRRDRFLIATKAGFQFTSLGGAAGLLKPLARAVLQRLRAARGLFARARESAVHHGARSQDFSAGRIVQCLEGSLRRLRTDRVEVFFLHNPPIEALRDEALLAALEGAVRAGKALRFGISTPEPAVAAAALEVPGASALEVPLHPGAAAAFRPHLVQAAARGFAILGNQVSFSGQLLQRASGLAGPADEVARLAAADGVSPHHLLLKFALAQPGVTAVLTGTTKPEHLRENVADMISPVVVSPATLATLQAAEGYPS